MEKEIYAINSNISWKLLKDAVVAVNLDSGAYYTFNYTASLIWQWVEQGKSQAEIAASLKEQFPDIQTVESDVSDIVKYWLSEKLISK
ncbi:MAG: PqqD family protein [Dysgonamonadaceae bacterium]|jgi:hypothetical protein|nr:PqqD family protein [Dysgonamonadaceae bacterium]